MGIFGFFCFSLSFLRSAGFMLTCFEPLPGFLSPLAAVHKNSGGKKGKGATIIIDRKAKANVRVHVRQTRRQESSHESETSAIWSERPKNLLAVLSRCLLPVLMDGTFPITQVCSGETHYDVTAEQVWLRKVAGDTEFRWCSAPHLLMADGAVGSVIESTAQNTQRSPSEAARKRASLSSAHVRPLEHPDEP
jgi:hypothetical protein